MAHSQAKELQSTEHGSAHYTAQHKTTTNLSMLGLTRDTQNAREGKRQPESAQHTAGSTLNALQSKGAQLIETESA